MTDKSSIRVALGSEEFGAALASALFADQLDPVRRTHFSDDELARVRFLDEAELQPGR